MFVLKAIKIWRGIFFKL